MVSASEHGISNSALNSDPDSYAIPTTSFGTVPRCIMYILRSLDIFRSGLFDNAAGVTGLLEARQTAGKAVLMGRRFRNASADGSIRGASLAHNPLDSALSFP